MKLLKTFLSLFMVFIIFNDCNGWRKKRKTKIEEPIFEVNDGDRKEFNFSKNEAIFNYQRYKNRLLRFISNSRLNKESKERISSQISQMQKEIEKIINTSREMEEKKINITNKIQLVLFNRTIETLNYFFSNYLIRIVKKYKKISELTLQSKEIFSIENIDIEVIDYLFLNSIKFSRKFDQLREIHDEMQRYILLFFDWLNVYLVSLEEVV